MIIAKRGMRDSLGGPWTLTNTFGITSSTDKSSTNQFLDAWLRSLLKRETILSPYTISVIHWYLINKGTFPLGVS